MGTSLLWAFCTLLGSGSIVARKMKKKKVMMPFFLRGGYAQHSHVKDQCDDRR